MKNLFVNENEIESIKVYDVRQAVGYEYRKQKKFLGFVTRKEGFYDSYNDIVLKEDLEKHGDAFVDGEKVFLYPTINICFSKSSYSYEKISRKTMQEIEELLLCFKNKNLIKVF